MSAEFEQFELKQGSAEWLGLKRKYYKSASNAGVVMGVSPFCTIKELAKRVKTGASAYVNKAMQAGIEWESHIRERAGEKLGEVFIPKVARRGDFLASLDGISFDGETIIEIKVSAKTLEALKKDEIPEHYAYQIQQQLYVFGAKRAYLVAFDPESNEMEISSPIFPCDSVWKIIQEKWADFDNFLITYEPPKEEERDDEEWNTTAIELQNVAIKRRALEQHEKELKERLILMAGGVKTRGAGVLVYESSTNNIDYKKLIADHNIDTAPYTKITKSWRVK